MEKTHYKLQFSIAMLNYQRVTVIGATSKMKQHVLGSMVTKVIIHVLGNVGFLSVSAPFSQFVLPGTGNKTWPWNIPHGGFHGIIFSMVAVPMPPWHTERICTKYATDAALLPG